jgi:hypothetical protein
MRDVKFQFAYTDLVDNNYEFKINWWWYWSNFSNTFRIDFHPPPYFQNITNNRVRFLIILIDTNAMLADYPNYVFDADIVHITSEGSRSIG